MKKTRPKYKVRLQRGRNARRRLWKRTERNNKKWKEKKTVRRVRKGRKGKPVTGTNRRTNEGRLRGGRAPRKGKLKRWRKKKRRGVKARKRRYGGAESKKELGALVRKKKKKNIREYRGREGGRRKGKEPVEGGRRRSQRKNPRDHVIGARERRADMRRWRAGRAGTLGEARERREKGRVSRVESGEAREKDVAEKGHKTKKVRKLKAGEGLKIKEGKWKERKGVRKEGQFGRGVRKRNGRSGRGYVLVDYRTGMRRVKRNPRSGEVRRPTRMERGRWMRRK